MPGSLVVWAVPTVWGDRGENGRHAMTMEYCTGRTSTPHRPIVHEMGWDHCPLCEALARIDTLVAAFETQMDDPRDCSVMSIADLRAPHETISSRFGHESCGCTHVTP